MNGKLLSPPNNKDQPRSGERLQPRACPELVEGAQALGRKEKLISPGGAKENIPHSAMLEKS
jgi:hypothetical protein